MTIPTDVLEDAEQLGAEVWCQKLVRLVQHQQPRPVRLQQKTPRTGNKLAFRAPSETASRIEDRKIFSFWFPHDTRDTEVRAPTEG